MRNLHFPQNFIFGTSLASFQVEGNTSGKRNTDWDNFFENNPDQIVRPGEVGPDWWGKPENIENDLKKIAETGVTMQRLSFEWDRIEPKKGELNHDALLRYRQIIDLCKKYNLGPMVTINHFTLPSWISNAGGWTNSEITDHIENYTSILLEEFSDVKYWVIVNEPGYVTYLGNLMGIFPPNKKSPIATFLTRKNIIKTQKRIYTLVKSKLPDSQVGNAFSILWLRSNDGNSILEKLLARTLNFILNTNFVSATKDYADFIGINFYTGYYIDLKISYFSTTMRNEASYIPYHLPFGKTVKPKTYKSDMGWPVVPDFFLDLLKHIYKTYKKPIFITENGIADRDDIYRSFYILTHLTSVAKAIEEGVDVRGYIHWATTDNLEWVEGYAKRFGLIAVDPVSGERQVRNGAKIYEEIINNKEIDPEKMIKQFILEAQKEYAKYVVEQLLRSNKDFCPRITRAI